MSMFTPFPKLARLSKNMVVTEKIDGTNAQIEILSVDSPLARAECSVAYNETHVMFAASRSRYLKVSDDNFGFARWVQDHADDLFALGEGRHYGEWWGAGIQRRYGLTEKRFSLFNVNRWKDERPTCCHVVPTLFVGRFSTEHVDTCLNALTLQGSQAAPGFMQPEGVVVFHTGSSTMFKKTLDGDGHKGAQ